jgi:hypothetical protein
MRSCNGKAVNHSKKLPSQNIVNETIMRSPKDCMWCTIAVRGLEKFLEYNHGTIEQKLSKYCDLFDKQLASLCKLIIAVEGYVQICEFVLTCEANL